MKLYDLDAVNRLANKRKLLTDRLNTLGMWEMDEITNLAVSVGGTNGVPTRFVIDANVIGGQEEIAQMVAHAVSDLLKSELELIEKELREEYGVEIEG